MKYASYHSLQYTSDLSGICSVLYELGGLIVMHDSSGCNSTFATHDEPRWYDTDSLIFISGLQEDDAVLGNDEKYIADVCEAAEEKHPKFIAVFGSPVALMTGTDFKGIARIIEDRTGIPTFGFKTTGMHPYIAGAQQALCAIAERFCPPDVSGGTGAAPSGTHGLRVNLLGVTPLDFSVVGNVEALRSFLSDNGFEEVSCWCMGSDLPQISRAGTADVNLVVSSMAIPAAKLLQEKYGTPYVVGSPMGTAGAARIAALLRTAAAEHVPDTLGEQYNVFKPNASFCVEEVERQHQITDNIDSLSDISSDILIIAEPVRALSLRWLLGTVYDAQPLKIRVVCPTENAFGLLLSDDLLSNTEDDIERMINASKLCIADPVYGNLLHTDSNTKLIRFPEETYSGRLYRSEIPVFIGPAFDRWLKKNLII